MCVEESPGPVPTSSESSACLPEGCRQLENICGPQVGSGGPPSTPSLPQAELPTPFGVLDCKLMDGAASPMNVGLLPVFLHQHRPDLPRALVND